MAAMKTMNTPFLQRAVFLLLLCAVTIAFAVILLPFFGAVFWAVVLAVLFAPLHRWLLRRLPGRPNLAALLTLSLCLLIAILPLMAITASLIQETTLVYQRVQSGELNFGTYLQRIFSALPAWLMQPLERIGLGDVASLQDKLGSGAAQGSRFVATQAINIGQNTFQFIVGFGIMLYLLFFLLRDGRLLIARVVEAIPLEPAHKRQLIARMATVTRATVKGNVVVAIVQGTLGGLAFWFLGIQGALLWAVLMAFLSLLPAIGAGLVWAPVAIYFLATGDWAKGIGLAAYGIIVIGMVDNVLRPILVGKDTRMPDYVVLISTIGGMALMGINGFVIGPMIAALFMAVWGMFVGREEDEEAEVDAVPATVVVVDVPPPADDPARSR